MIFMVGPGKDNLNVNFIEVMLRVLYNKVHLTRGGCFIVFPRLFST